MREETVSADKPFAGKSKKEHISGTRPMGSPPDSGPLFGGIRIEEAITIGRSIEDVYSYWRDFTNLPRFCKNLKSVSIIDPQRSTWIVDGPAGKELKWDATIIEDRRNELISWRSLEQAEFENAGSVRFKKAPADKGTEIVLTLAYNPPAGPLGSLIAKFTAKEPAVLLREQLRRLKALLETGEIPTTDGQPTVIEK